MKRYIRAMSMEKDKAKHQISSFSPVIMEHVIKLLMYSDIRPDDVQGWIHTIANWIYRADSITVKPSAKKLSKADFMSSLFSCMGDDIRDYERALYAFLADNYSGKFNHEGKGSYPEFEVTYDVADTLMACCYQLIEATLPLLQDKADHSISDYEGVVRMVFGQFL